MRKLSMLELAVGRSSNYYSKSPEGQWEEDKELGILDWDGSVEWLTAHGKLKFDSRGNILKANEEVPKEDEEPVLVVLTKDKKLIQAGKPENASAKDLKKYVSEGCEIKTITISEFRKTDWKWYWEKD